MATHDVYPQYYKTIRRFSPGTIPDDVKVVDYYETTYYDYLAFNRSLTESEMDYFHLQLIDEDELAKLGIGPYYKD